MKISSSFCLVLPLGVALSACLGESTDKDGDPESCDTGICDEDTDNPIDNYEEGCTTVDGMGGFKWINDAIAVASEGSEIHLCASDTGHEEEVIVDKAVSIIGPGSENYLLIAPTNVAGVLITADDASLSGIAVDSTRSGVEVEEGSNVSLSDIQVMAAGNWGVKATDASDLTITDSIFMGNGYGGIQVDGGTVSVTSSDLSGNISYGALATGGASLTVSGSLVGSTTQNEAGDGSDGVGLRAEDGSYLEMSDNEVSNSAFVNVWADEADLSLTGDILTGGLYGIAAIYGDLSLTDVSVTDGFLYGVFAISQTFIDVSGATVSADPETTQSVPDDEDGDGYAEWGGEDYGYSGTGLYLVADEITLSGSHIEGYNNAGMVLGHYDSGAATISDVTIDNTGRHGIYFIAADATVTDTTVTNLRQVEDQGDSECYTVDRYAAITTIEGTLDWQGGEVSGHEGYGFTNVRGNIAVADALIASNNCAGVMNYGGTDLLTGNTFTGAAPSQLSASVVEYGNTDSVISGNTFIVTRMTRSTSSSTTTPSTTTRRPVRNSPTTASPIPTPIRTCPRSWISTSPWRAVWPSQTTSSSPGTSVFRPTGPRSQSLETPGRTIGPPC